jgi:hypothetical protein
LIVPTFAVLTIEFQVPIIGGVLLELVGKIGAVAFLQTEGIKLKIGVTLGIISIVKVVFVAQIPEFGVKV